MAEEYPLREAGETDIPVLVQFRRRMLEEIRLSRWLPAVPVEMAAMEEAYARFARSPMKLDMMAFSQRGGRKFPGKADSKRQLLTFPLKSAIITF